MVVLASWCDFISLHLISDNFVLFFLKLKIELPYDEVIPLLGIHPNKMKTLIQKDICTPVSQYAMK